MFGLFNKKLSDDYISNLSFRPQFTPDLWKIEQSPVNLLFEYGELKSEMPKATGLTHPLLPAFSIEKMSLWSKLDGENTRAVAIRLGSDVAVPKAKIYGELHAVTVEGLIRLDTQRQNGVNFKRKRVQVILEAQDNKFNDIIHNAWMYVGVRSFWEPQITWDQSFHKNSQGSAFLLANIAENDRPSLGRYYNFTSKDFRKVDEKKCFLSLRNGSEQRKDPRTP